jgi:hypothetical protein
MSLTSVYLYSYKIDAYIYAIEDTTASTRYKKVYNQNLKIYRSVDNRINIRVKNSSQKSINIGNSALVFRLVADNTEKLILEQDCVIVDPSLGIAHVDLLETTMEQLDEGSYYYTLTQEFREPTSVGYTVIRRVPLYIDSQQGIRVPVLVVGDVKGSFRPSVIIDTFNLTNPAFLGEMFPRFRISSIVDANPWTTVAKTLHTFQFYFSETYQGKVNIEASIDLQGASPRNWFVVHEFEPTSTREYHNVAGKFSWFRIKHFPQVQNPIGTPNSITYDVEIPRLTQSQLMNSALWEDAGTLDKVLYR